MDGFWSNNKQIYYGAFVTNELQLTLVDLIKKYAAIAISCMWSMLLMLVLNWLVIF
jgi:hypothetical protein